MKPAGFVMHESGNLVKFAQAGAELFAERRRDRGALSRWHQRLLSDANPSKHGDWRYLQYPQGSRLCYRSPIPGEYSASRFIFGTT